MNNTEYSFVKTFQKHNGKRNHRWITIKCDTHGEIDMLWNGFLSGNRCRICGIEKSARTNTISNDKARKFIENSTDYEFINLVTKEYNSQNTSFLVLKCDIHGEFEIRWSNVKVGHGCSKCGQGERCSKLSELYSGSNASNWQGGITELAMYLRLQLNPWVQQQLQRANYCCELTGKQGNLNVHHMFSFKKILDITMNELRMDTRATVGDYTEDELQFITVNLIKNNDILANPKVLLESVHQEFHAFCGGNQVDTTQELWGSFVLQRPALV